MRTFGVLLTGAVVFPLAWAALAALIDPNGPSRQEWRQRVRAEYEADWVPPGTNRSKRA